MQQRISMWRLQGRGSRMVRAVLTGGSAATALAGSVASVRGRRAISLPLLARL